MKRFVLLLRGGAFVDATMTPAVRAAHRERWNVWTTALTASGHLPPGGQTIYLGQMRTTIELTQRLESQ